MRLSNCDITGLDCLALVQFHRWDLQSHLWCNRNKVNNWVYVTKLFACRWSLWRIGMPRRIPDFNPIKFFQPLITFLSQIDNVATFWKKVKQIWRKSVGIKRAFIIKPVPQSVSRWLIHPTNMGEAVSMTCHNQESGLFPCLHPSHPHLKDEDARLQTFGPNWPHHHHNLSPRKTSKAGFFWLGQGDRVKCYYCDGGLSRWKTDDDVFVEPAKWFPHCELPIATERIFFCISNHVQVDKLLSTTLTQAGTTCACRSSTEKLSVV